MAYWFNNIDNPIDKKFFDNFNEFVCAYHGLITNDNWKGVILEQTFGDEQTALNTFFELFDLFMDGAKPADTKKIVLALFDKFLFEQDEMKRRLGNDFSPVLSDAAALIKDNALSNLKYDYDLILEQLNEKAGQIPELKNILADLNTQVGGDRRMAASKD